MSVSAAEFAKSDAQLAADGAFALAHDKFSKRAPANALAKTVAALTEKKHVVKVVKDEAEAVAYVNSLIPDGASVSSGGSTTLQQIGFVDALKLRADKVDNLKGKALEARARGDLAAYALLSRQGAAADFFLSSVSAISAEGDLFAADAGGTRISGWTAATTLIIVAGTNKIVADEAEAEERLYQYQVCATAQRDQSANARACSTSWKAPGSGWRSKFLSP
jgi:hypothetical protein